MSAQRRSGIGYQILFRLFEQGAVIIGIGCLHLDFHKIATRQFMDNIRHIAGIAALRKIDDQRFAALLCMGGD